MRTKQNIYGDLFDSMANVSMPSRREEAYKCLCVKENAKLEVEKVIFNDNATIVYFSDGVKTVVKRQGEDACSKEVGLMAAFSKKLFGNDNTFNKIINKYCSEYYNHDERIQCGLEKLAKNLNDYEDSIEVPDYSRESYEKVCNTIKDFVVETEEDVNAYKELIKIKSAIKSYNRLFESIYMTDSYVIKPAFRYGGFTANISVPEYAKEFIKLAKKYFNVNLTIVNLKDNKFKIILKKEDYDVKQK